jgi:hypothetical protein
MAIGLGGSYTRNLLNDVDSMPETYFFIVECSL